MPSIPWDIAHFERLLPPETQRIPLKTFWDALEQFPEVKRGDDMRAVLSSLLEVLVLEREYKKPRNPALYDKSALPHLPYWLQRPVFSFKEKGISFNPKKHLWHPELAFLSKEKHLPAFEKWLAVDQWLKKGEKTSVVPRKERSYEIFGEEKLLDSFIKNQFFTRKQITEKTLHCREIYEPLPWERGPLEAKGKPCLIVENASTWWSLGRWNQKHGIYSSVIYGSGKAIEKNWQGLEYVLRECPFSQVRYFGDIDYDGIMIPFRTKPQVETNLSVPFVAEKELYRQLLSITEDYSMGIGEKKIISEEALGFIPSIIREGIRNILDHHWRIPQEALRAENINFSLNF